MSNDKWEAVGKPNFESNYLHEEDRNVYPEKMFYLKMFIDNSAPKKITMWPSLQL